jgi:hypothetical protein
MDAEQPTRQEVGAARRTTYYRLTRIGVELLTVGYVASEVLALVEVAPQMVLGVRLALSYAVQLVGVLVVRSLVHRFLDLVDATVEQRARMHV